MKNTESDIALDEQLSLLKLRSARLNKSRIKKILADRNIPPPLWTFFDNRTDAKFSNKKPSLDEYDRIVDR